MFILCITLDWRLQASVYCHWISDVVCFATCNLNVSSHTRKGPRLGKFSCIFCFALLNNRVLINGALRSWFFITCIFNMSLFCLHSSILLQFNVNCLQGRLSFYFRFFSFSPSFNFVPHVCFVSFLYEENSTSFSLIRQTESKDTPFLSCIVQTSPWKFTNRTGTLVDEGARKSKNWREQWQRCKLDTGSRV